MLRQCQSCDSSSSPEVSDSSGAGPWRYLRHGATSATLPFGWWWSLVLALPPRTATTIFPHHNVAMVLSPRTSLPPSSVSPNLSLTESLGHDCLLPSSCISTFWSLFRVASPRRSFNHVSLSSSPSLTTRSRACSSDHTFFNQALPSSRISSHDCCLPWSFSYGSHPQASSQPVARVTDSFHCWHRGRMVHSKTHARVVLLLWLCSVHFVHHSRASTSCNWLQSDMLRRRTRWCFFSAVVLWPCICIIMDVALPVVAGSLARSLGSTILLPWVFVFCLVKLDQLHSVTKLLVVMDFLP